MGRAVRGGQRDIMGGRKKLNTRRKEEINHSGIILKG
jgi:hypothetical protein